MSSLTANAEFLIKLFWTLVSATALFFIVSSYRKEAKRRKELEGKLIDYDIKAIRDANARRLIGDILADANSSREKRLEENSGVKKGQ